jgi:hypothetical protein
MKVVPRIARLFRSVSSGSLEKSKAVWARRMRLNPYQFKNEFLLGISKKYGKNMNMNMSVRKLGPCTAQGREFFIADSLPCFHLSKINFFFFLAICPLLENSFVI